MAERLVRITVNLLTRHADLPPAQQCFTACPTVWGLSHILLVDHVSGCMLASISVEDLPTLPTASPPRPQRDVPNTVRRRNSLL